MQTADLPIAGNRAARVTRVLVVDDEPGVANLLAEMLRHGGHSCLVCFSGQEALDRMAAQRFDAIFSDLIMPGMSGLQLLQTVRTMHTDSAFVMATEVNELDAAMAAMREGADDYILKPFHQQSVLVSLDRVVKQKQMESELEDYRGRIEELVNARTGEIQQAMQRLEQTHHDTSQALAAALDLRVNDTAGHSWRVRAYALELGKVMGCGPAELDAIGRGALLHDIGKIGIPDAILMKPGSLSRRERTAMMTHVGTGYNLLSHFEFLEGAAKIVLTHHERFDGKGYPQGLAGEDIPLGARIFAVADTLDAMTSDRPYRQALNFAAAREEIIRESGGQFDPRVVAAFLTIEEARWDEIRTHSETIRSLGIVESGLPELGLIDRTLQAVAAVA